MTTLLPDLSNPIDPTLVDLKPFILNLYIADKAAGLQRLGDIIHPAQLDIIEQVNRCINTGIPCRIIVLKARQIGVSTIIEAIQFALAFIKSRFKGLVVSHEADSAEHILGMTQTYYDMFFARDYYTQKNRSAKVLSWVETQSQLRIATAKNEGSGRSRTIHFLHGSEVGFWDNADTLMTGLLQSVPSIPLSFVFLESTANGIGNYFHKTWNQSCSGDLDYLPRFYPWWTHPEYLGSVLHLSLIRGHLDKEERALVKLMRNPPKERWNDFSSTPLTNGEILDRLTWRRYAIKNLCKSDLNKFHQEYPATPEEAFLSTGHNVFPLESVDAIFQTYTEARGELTREGEKIRFQRSNEGPLKIYKQPSRNADYVIAGDSARAVEGDYACCQVLNRSTWEQVAVYRAKVDPVTFGEEMIKLGYFYNSALAVCEIEGGGYGTIAVLMDRNYPYVWQHQKAEKMPGQMDNSFGWSTNWKTKSQALANLKKSVIDRVIIIHDRSTYNEMINYVALPGGKFGNGENEGHDDTVMSLAIAVTVTIYEAAEILSKQSNRSSDFVPTGRGLRHTTMQEPETLPGMGDNQVGMGDIAIDSEPEWKSWNIGESNDNG